MKNKMKKLIKRLLSNYKRKIINKDKHFENFKYFKHSKIN